MLDETIGGRFDSAYATPDPFVNGKFFVHAILVALDHDWIVQEWLPASVIVAPTIEAVKSVPLPVIVGLPEFVVIVPGAAMAALIVCWR